MVAAAAIHCPPPRNIGDVMSLVSVEEEGEFPVRPPPPPGLAEIFSFPQESRQRERHAPSSVPLSICAASLVCSVSTSWKLWKGEEFLKYLHKVPSHFREPIIHFIYTN